MSVRAGCGPVIGLRHHRNAIFACSNGVAQQYAGLLASNIPSPTGLARRVAHFA